MDTQAYLSQLINLRVKLENTNEQIIRLKQKMIYSSPQFEADAGSGTSVSGGGEKLAKQTAQLEIMEKDVVQMEKDIKQKTKSILRIIDGVENAEHSELLYLRYIKGFSMSVVARRMNRTTSWVYHNHSIAIDDVTQILKLYYRVKQTYYVLNIDTGVIEHQGTINEIAKLLNVVKQEVYAHVAQELPLKNKVVLSDVTRYDDVIRNIINIKSIQT